MLKISRWHEYEKADTRKVKGGLSWIARSVDLLSGDVLEIMAEPDHLSILGAFDLIVRYACSRCSSDRGAPINLEARVLAVALRTSEAAIRRAVEVLSRPSIAWVETDWPNVTAPATPNPGDAAATPAIADLRECECGHRAADHREGACFGDMTCTCAGVVLRAAGKRPADLPTNLGGSSDDVRTIVGVNYTTLDQEEKNTPPPASAVETPPARSISRARISIAELAVWDRVFLEVCGMPYVRTAWAKEGKLAGTLRSAEPNPERIEAAMRAALADPWFTDRGGDFSLFVSMFSRFSALARSAQQKTAGGALGVLARDAAAAKSEVRIDG